MYLTKTANPTTADGLDVRFVVNTFAPWLLTLRLLPLMVKHGRVVNLSSAIQGMADIAGLKDEHKMDDMAAYAQNKLATTIWSRELAAKHPEGPAFFPVNPGSLLVSKMVKAAANSSAEWIATSGCESPLGGFCGGAWEAMRTSTTVSPSTDLRASRQPMMKSFAPLEQWTLPDRW